MRRNHAAKFGLDWLPSIWGGPVEDKFVTAWDCMKARCNVKKHKYYKNYGARGIKVCDRWQVFPYFFIDMWDSYLLHIQLHGIKNTSLDRINNDQGYSKKNCKWSTGKEQQYNRTNTIRVRGKTLHEWSIELGVNRRVLYHRLHVYKLPIDQVLSKGKLQSGRKKSAKI